MTPALLPSLGEPHTIDPPDSAELDRPRLVELLPITPTGALRFAVAQVDRDGVVSANLASMLGWRRDDQQQLIIVPGPASAGGVAGATSLLVRRDPADTPKLTSRHYLRLPASVRRRCQICTNDPVLIAADPALDVLVIHPKAAIDAMIGSYHAGLLGDDR